MDDALKKNQVTVQWIVQKYVEVIARSEANMQDFASPVLQMYFRVWRPEPQLSSPYVRERVALTD